MKTVTIYLQGNTITLELAGPQMAALKNAAETQGWFYAVDGDNRDVQINGAYILGFAAA